MAEAKINREYLLRMAGVAVFMFGICLWSLYDGLVAWPEKNREFDRVRPALLATNLTAKVWISRVGEHGHSPLERCFAAHELKTPSRLVKKINEFKMPDNSDESMIAQSRERERSSLKGIFEGSLYDKHDLQGQIVMAVLTALAALSVVCSFAVKIPRRYVTDINGLSGSGFGIKTINYDDIESIDWKKWDKKGIVRLSVKGGEVHILDGWHFSGINEIVDTIVKQRPELGMETET